MTFTKANHQAKYLAVVADDSNSTTTITAIGFDQESGSAYAVAHCGCYKTHPCKFESEAAMVRRLHSRPEEFGVREVL